MSINKKFCPGQHSHSECYQWWQDILTSNILYNENHQIFYSPRTVNQWLEFSSFWGGNGGKTEFSFNILQEKSGCDDCRLCFSLEFNFYPESDSCEWFYWFVYQKETQHAIFRWVQWFHFPTIMGTSAKNVCLVLWRQVTIIALENFLRTRERATAFKFALIFTGHRIRLETINLTQKFETR